GGFSSTKRDSVVIVGGYWTVPLLNTRVLFYLRCRAKPDAIDGSIGEVRPQRLLQNNVWLSYFNERDKPTCVVQNGVVKIRNPVPVPITLSLPSIAQINAGQPALMPVSVDLLTMRDSVTTVNLNMRLPSGVVFSDVSMLPGELLPDGTVLTTTPVEGGIVVSCVSPHLISGSGELLTVRLTAASTSPDSVSGPVALERVTSGVGYLDYFVKLKRPVVVSNGVVLVRNLNMVPVHIAVSADSSVDAGSPCSIQVQGSGLLSFNGTTTLQFALTVPPGLYQSVSVQGGLLPADAVTLADAGSGLFRVSGSVANPAGGTGTLFTVQGLTKQDIPDSTVFAIAIERLSDGGSPLPYVRKGDQTPDCTVSNGAVTVRSPVSVAYEGVALPSRSELTAYPNPFNAVITFRVHGPLSDGPIDATLYTVLGTVVCRWSQSTPEWTWDGRDASGVPAASGVYVVVVRNGEKTWQKRVTLLR
ncbi:MAG TPA: T9SS type A sorting domain-containing protein, partial [Candidatus Latescibacteria bacterium]|nr:T9SS type A sorting domain-containing protein [Candidatus Latescibacterota bacterium]